MYLFGAGVNRVVRRGQLHVIPVRQVLHESYVGDRGQEQKKQHTNEVAREGGREGGGGGGIRR